MTAEFKVLIVGGSVAGLSLAHCLESLDIPYTILEQGERIAPQLGASIGILPNGARILDQLGIFDDVEKEIEPLELAEIRFPDKFCFESRYPQALHANFGYPVSFLERQKFLEILYRKLKHKLNIHTAKKVISVETNESEAVVKTRDGARYAADLVVGADGVHSIVRSEIWRQFRQASQTPVAEHGNSGIRYEYSCVYGISVDVPHTQPGVQLSLLDDGVSIHAITGRNSKLFWFIILKASQGNDDDDDERYSVSTAKSICEGLGSKCLSDTVTFGDVWSRCTIYKMTPLEEGVFERWNYGRLLCIGDAVRKMAPNLGQGANMAIEDAARLANLLDKLRSSAKLSTAAISHALDDLTATQKGRTKRMCLQSEFLVRMHAHQGMGRIFVGRYLIPLLSDAPAALSGISIRGAAKLDSMQLPARSLGRAWDASCEAVIRSLASLRPKLSGSYSFYLIVSVGIVCVLKLVDLYGHAAEVSNYIVAVQKWHSI